MRHLLLVLLAFILASPSLFSQTTSRTGSNPFFQTWDTPFGVPPFNSIRNEHYLPAIKEGIARKLKDIAAIASNADAPTFENTVVAMNDAGDFLERVLAVFGNISASQTNDTLQAVDRETAPLLASLNDDILLNAKLFARVSAVWEKRESLPLDPEQKKLLEDTYRKFVRGGANLDAAKQKRLREINGELSLLTVRFGENVLKATAAYRLVVDRKENLAGLPDNLVSAAADEARAAKLKDSWVFTLQAPSIFPFLTYAVNRDLRKQMLEAYLNRCDRGTAYDNTGLVTRIVQLRAERAMLLGYPTCAAYVLEERMAKAPEHVYTLLDKIRKPALVAARREADDLMQLMSSEGEDVAFEAWDWRYYAEKLKRARYALDEHAVQQYLSLDNVRQGAFHVANRLYGLTFIERRDIPVYNPDVRAYEVLDRDSSHLGVLLTDYSNRPGKRVGAWSSEFRTQEFRGGKDIRPIVVNVCNFPRPTGDMPALLRLEEAETLFHEFGHALQALVSRIHYRSLSDVPRDFVELPSQIMEHWATHPDVMHVYAKHWKTGERIPDSLIARISATSTFDQGYATMEYLAAAYLDMDWHTLNTVKPVDALDFERSVLSKVGLIREIPVRYRSAYFRHIFSGGYAAGYYSYIWSEVLDADAFEAFKEKGIFDQATAESFRRNILEKAGADDPMAMWIRFRGREPNVNPLLVQRGLAADAKGTQK